MTLPLLNLVQGTWEDAESFIGRELDVITGADAVSAADVRRRLEVYGVESAVNTDDRVAREHGYPRAPAPATMLLTWCMPPYWRAGNPPVATSDPLLLPPFPVLKIPAPGDNAFATHIVTYFHEPVYVGDRITATTRLLSLTRKKTRVGDGAFFTIETKYTNQDGIVNGVEQSTLYRYSAASRSGAPGKDKPSAPPAALSGGETADGDGPSARPVVAAFVIPLTRQRLVMAAAANRDFAPMHYDRSVAVTAGAPEAFTNVMFLQTLLEVTVSRSLGSAARLKRLELSMLRFNCCGDLLRCGGEITSVARDPGGDLTELDLRIESQHGVTVSATATVAVPAQAAV